jgi:glutamate N-acetyltransferase/amino-acid N-acetyltransferase
VDEDEFSRAVHDVLLDLTVQLARDGEGATKLLIVTATSARDAAQAKRVAKTVLNSPLVKTAVHGADPNWGRVAMAVGKCQDDTDIDPDRISIFFGDLCLYPQETAGPDLDRLRHIMSAEQVEITVDLGLSDPAEPHRATVYGCDLSADYVRINADYTT